MQFVNRICLHHRQRIIQYMDTTDVVDWPDSEGAWWIEFCHATSAVPVLAHKKNGEMVITSPLPISAWTPTRADMDAVGGAKFVKVKEVNPFQEGKKFIGDVLDWKVELSDIQVAGI